MRTYILSFTSLSLSGKRQCSTKAANDNQTTHRLFRFSVLFFMSLFLTAHAGQNNLTYTIKADHSTNLAGVANLSSAVQVNVTNAACTDSGTVTIAPTGTWGSYIIADSDKATISSGILNQNRNVTVTMPAGTYTITLTDSSGQTVSQTVVISGAAFALPIAQFQITTGSSLVAITEAQAGERIAVTATIGGPAFYQWTFGNGEYDTDGVASTVYKSAGTYSINLVVTNPAGCTATAAQTITITDAATGIYNVSGNGTPAIWSNNNIVYVDFRDVADMDATVNVYDILGKQLSSERSGQLLYQKQIDNISAGYFIVAVNNHNKTTTKKVFINNVR